MSTSTTGTGAPPYDTTQQQPTVTPTGNSFDQVAQSVAGTSGVSGVAAPSISSGSNYSTVGSGVEAPPGAAYSSYQFQTYVAGTWVSLGTTMASLLGLSATGGPNGNGVYSGDEVIQAYAQLSAAEQANVDRLLYQGGYYASDLGTPSSTGPVLGGGVQNPGFEALSAAIVNTSETNPSKNSTASGVSPDNGTLSSVIGGRISSGAGEAAIRQNLSPLVGGGNTYQVNLTSPKDIYATAYSTFESTLGRAPTKAELDAITATLQSQEASYAQAQNTQQESAAQTKYQTEIASRNAVQTPVLSTGAIPNGPFTDPNQYAVALLEYLGVKSISPTAVAFLSAWIAKNGGLNGAGAFNPLAVNATQAGSTPSSTGSANYQSWAQGLAAAANLLQSPQYEGILGYLTGAPTTGGTPQAQAVTSLINQELSQWSSGAIPSLTPTKAQVAAAAKTLSQYTPSSGPQSGQPLTGQQPVSNSPTGMPNPSTRAQTTDQGPAGINPQGLSDAAAAQLGQSPSPISSSGTAPGTTSASPAVQAYLQTLATMKAAQANPEVAAYLRAQAALGQQNTLAASPTTIQPSQIGSGQGLTSPGDNYVPSTTLTDITPPSAQAASFTAATTGANTTPYLGNQYLQAYENIMQIMKAEV